MLFGPNSLHAFKMAVNDINNITISMFCYTTIINILITIFNKGIRNLNSSESPNPEHIEESLRFKSNSDLVSIVMSIHHLGNISYHSVCVSVCVCVCVSARVCEAVNYRPYASPSLEVVSYLK